MKTTLVAYHLGDRLDIKEIKHGLTFHCIYSDPTEIIFETDKGSYCTVFDYGSIVFLGVSNTEQTEIIKIIRSLLRIKSNELKRENFDIEVNPGLSYKVLFDKLIIKEISFDIARILMLNIAQSVALDYYIEQSNHLLTQIFQFSEELEAKGKFSIKGKKLLQYIGSTLNLKNKIAQNLYIFDSPNLTWNDEFLNVLNKDLGRELDIKIRHASLQDNLNTVRENLEILKDISQHTYSSRLEWVVIILITFEIIDLLITKIF